MTRIAVTGGSGGAGSAVIPELLSRDYDVVNLDRLAPSTGRCPFVEVDLVDYGATFAALHGCDAVVHLGAHPSPDQDHLTGARRFNNNTTSTFNVFNAAAALGIQRVVWASSDTVLGYPFARVRPHYLPVDEAHPLQPQNGYALSKALCEELARQMSHLYGITIIGLRFSHIMHADAAFRAHYGQVPQFWSNSQQRKFNLWGYVDSRDVAQSVRLSLEADIIGAEVFLISAADTIMNRANADLVAEVFPDTPLRRELGEFTSLLKIDKAHQMLGYTPRYSWRNHVDVFKAGW